MYIYICNYEGNVPPSVYHYHGFVATHALEHLINSFVKAQLF